MTESTFDSFGFLKRDYPLFIRGLFGSEGDWLPDALRDLRIRDRHI